MRKTQSIEIVGLGDFKTYPIKATRQEFPRVNKNGTEVKRKTEGYSRGKTYFEDSEGNKYEESEVFYLIGKAKVQKVKKTEKISDFKIVDKMEVYNFMSDGYYILDYSNTALQNFERIAKDNAIKFQIKSSSTGMKWDLAYILKFEGRLLMFKGMGKISEGIKEFTLMKQSEKKSQSIKETIEIKAEELNKEIEWIIAI